MHPVSRRLRDPRAESIRALAASLDAHMEDEPPAPAPPAPTPAPPPAAPASTSPAATPPAGGDAKTVAELPQWAQDLIGDVRKEAGESRAAKTAADQDRQKVLDGIAAALGVKDEGAPPDPAMLQQTITDRDARISGLEAAAREKDVELAAWRSASKQGANVAALLDSRAFLTTVAGLDPTVESFAADLDAAVNKAVTDNPALRAHPVPTPGQAGIGTSGARPEVAVAPGMARLRAAYATTP